MKQETMNIGQIANKFDKKVFHDDDERKGWKGGKGLRFYCVFIF